MKPIAKLSNQRLEESKKMLVYFNKIDRKLNK